MREDVDQADEVLAAQLLQQLDLPQRRHIDALPAAQPRSAICIAPMQLQIIAQEAASSSRSVPP